MPYPGKKKYDKQADRSPRLERDNFIEEHSMMKKGTAMRKQINQYWKKRAEEEKRYFHRATQTNKS